MLWWYRFIVPAAGALLGLAACSPVLDWRDVRPPESSAALQFPCRPASQQRQVALAGSPVALTVYACSAGEQTWGFAFADVADAARLDAALTALAASAAANIAAQAAPLRPGAVPGALAQPAAGHLRLLGKLPDGTPVQMQLLLFARGTRVFQATVLGRQVGEEAAQTFFASIRLVR